MKRSFRVVALAVLALLLIGPVPNSLARAPGRQPVGRNVANPKVIEVGEGVAAAYGTGTIVHADALRTGEHALVDVDVAFSGAAFSQAAPPEEYTNEVHRTVTKLLKDNKISYGRGTGLELGIGSDPVPLIGQLSEAAAPASTDLIHKFVGPIGVPGLIRAELLRSQAQARAIEGGCPLGKDAAYGLGSVLNLELLGGLIATHAKPPYREVSQSNSTTRIVRRASDGRLGLKSETRQTILPVTLLQGTPLQFTVEVLGEWALRATAYGDESSVHYGPLDVSPQTPVVRILDAKGKPIIQVTTQMLLGKKGLEVVIPEVAEIVIGEDPRMIGDNASSDPLTDPDKVAAAADVVRVKLFQGAVADVRVGHMEAAATVPSGGITNCPGLIVDQTVDKPTVTTDEEFTYTITVKNPNDCVVAELKLVDTATLPAGVTIQLVPGAGGSAVSNVVTFPNLGSLGPGEEKTFKITSKVALGSAEGLIKALAVAEGVCPAEVQPPNDTDGPQTPGTPETEDIPVRGEDSVDGPNVDTCTVPEVVGENYADAVKLITDAGCVVGKKTEDPDADEDDEGKVTEQGTPPGTSVPKGTPVDLTIGGDLCNVPSVIGQTPGAADDILEKEGCDLGNTETKPNGNGGTPGTITTQDPPAGDVVPAGTKVDVVLLPGGDSTLVAASTNCTVPDLVGMTEAEARTKVEAAGCVLVTQSKNTTNPNQLGKVMSQNPGKDAVLPRGSQVNVDLGVQVLGETLTAGQEADAAAPNLARTGGLFLGGLSLWLLLGGVAARAAGSKRLWRLVRRSNG
ncbi:MAG TPA: PASTA domain-containing protein [Acidimicrobiia bacterium]|nr:PASTA domain-containing protein [Acidimicrobiia bacterium]